MLLLPLFPYFIKHKKYKTIAEFPSFLPFWLTVVVLVQIVNWVWANIFNGKLFYEWDTLFIQYSLTYYQAPVLDSSPSWIAPGLTLWHLYLLFVIITIGIYLIAMFISLIINKGNKHYKEYKEVFKISVIWMSVISILSYPLLAIMFWVVSRVILK